MKLEFPKHFLDLFEGSRERLQQDLILKLEVIRETQMNLKSSENNNSIVGRVFTFGVLGGVIKEMKKATSQEAVYKQVMSMGALVNVSQFEDKPLNNRPRLSFKSMKSPIPGESE